MAVKSEHVKSTADRDSSMARPSVGTPTIAAEPTVDLTSEAVLNTTLSGFAAHAAGVRRLRGNLRADLLTHVQQNFGNRYVQRVMDHAFASNRPDGDLAQRIQAASSDGSALDASTRERLQASLGADLSGVKVHQDAEADRLAEAVDAVAFTTGNDVFFRQGMYQPTSPAGLRLIAHEVTHTLQQSNGSVDGTLSAGGVSISDPTDSFEQAAEQAADRVVANQRVAPDHQATPANASSQLAVQRDEDLGDIDEWPENQPAEGAQDAEQIVDTMQSAKSVVDLGLDVAGGYLEGNEIYDTAMIGYEGLGLGLDVYGNQVSGQSGGESTAGAVGGFLASKGLEELGGGGAGDAKINAINGLANLAFGPHAEGDTLPGVTDITQVAADMTASQFAQNAGSNIGRGLYNVATGDTEALERQGQELETGESGAALQGYSLAADVMGEAAGDKDLETAIIDVGSKGQDSSIARLGNYLGDEAYQFINKDLPEASEFAQKDLANAWNWLTE